MEYWDEINLCATLIKNNKIILCPTDTVWGLSCGVYNQKAIENLLILKNRPSHKSFILLVNSIEMLQDYVMEIPRIFYEINLDKKPCTIIFNKPKNIDASLLHHDGSIGIRIIKKSFCNDLIDGLKMPILSTSANLSGEAAPLYYNEISETIKSKVNHVVSHEHEFAATGQPSKIIKLINDFEYKIIRD